MGKWDRNAGIISLFIKESEGVKQARLLVAEEHVEDASSKLSFAMLPADLDDLEDLIEDTLIEMGKPEIFPIPTEAGTLVGQLSYPSGIIKISIVYPVNTGKYVSMLIRRSARQAQFIFWMEKQDLVSLKRLIDRTLNELGES